MNQDYRTALKKTRVKLNLYQKQIAELIGIPQTKYSALETGKNKLDEDTLQFITTIVYGILPQQLIEFSNSEIDILSLPEKTKNTIDQAQSNKMRNSDNLLAKELDAKINDGNLNIPLASYHILVLMSEGLQDKNPSEITNHLIKPPRNKIIVKLLIEYNNNTLFVHKDHAHKYINLSQVEITQLMVDYEERMNYKVKKQE